MQSKKVYIAPDGFVAFIDRAHPKHLHAAAHFRYFGQNNFQLYTSVVTINEVSDELARTISPSLAKDFLRAIELTDINSIYPEESDLRKSIRTLISSQSTDLSFSKALMSIICNKKSIYQICTFEHFPLLFGLQMFYLPI